MIKAAMEVIVFASSSSKIKEEYFAEASTLGKRLALEGHGIIYGGGGIGLMGALADSAIENGGRVTGVIPEFMLQNGWGRKELNSMIVTENMSCRKQKIFEMGEAVIALPGGVGTLEELTEAITLKQLGLFMGPIVMINTAGFYDPLIRFLEQLIDGNFMREVHRQIWEVAGNASEATAMVGSYRGWMDDPASIARI